MLSGLAVCLQHGQVDAELGVERLGSGQLLELLELGGRGAVAGFSEDLEVALGVVGGVLRHLGLEAGQG